MHLSFWALPILVPFILICCIPEAGAQKIEREKKVRKAVSYTHLTLPTTPYV